MSITYTTDQIKNAIPLPQAIESYTGERLSKNKMRCPLHNEKTASFTVYPDNNTFYCFGCGASGDIIHFVQRYFDIGFKEAIKRLDCDYNLGLTRAPTFSEYRRQQREAAKRKAEQERQRNRERQLNKNYWSAFDEVLQYEKSIELFRPLNPGDNPHPLFIKALQNIEYTRYLLDCAENERRGRFFE